MGKAPGRVPGTLAVLAASALSVGLVLGTGGARSALGPVLILPVALAIVLAGPEMVGAMGALQAALSVLTGWTAAGVTRASLVDAIVAAAVSLVGVWHVRRIDRRQADMSRAVEEKASLLNVLQMLNSTEKLDAALNTVLLLLTLRIPRLRCAALFLTEDTRRHMHLAGVIGLEPSDLRCDRLSVAVAAEEMGPAGVLEAPDARPDSAPHLARIDPGARSAVCVELRSLKAAAGLLYLSSDRPVGLDTHQVEFLRALGDLIGFPLQRIRAHGDLHGMAYTDPMTGLPNFRDFRRHLEDEMRRAARYHRPLSTIILDLDNFKAVNDQYGHPAGDRLLSGVAAIIRRSIRETDLPARYGGEEFVVICPETGGAEVSIVAERIRAAVEAARFELVPGEVCAMTVSAGFATYPRSASDDASLIGAADAALYRAKHSGKNQVCGADEMPSLLTPVD